MLVSGVIFTRINSPFDEWLELLGAEQDKNQSSAEISTVQREQETLYPCKIQRHIRGGSLKEIISLKDKRGRGREGRIWRAAR